MVCADIGVVPDQPLLRVPELETRDFIGVDILAAGGPYFGGGSPPEGDMWTEAQLEELAATHRELAEVRSPIKLGHSKDQPLLRESGLVDAAGAPAAGWLENYRVGTGDKAGKLLVDLRKVPARLAGLVESGAFRTRSVELASYTPPTPGAKPRTIVSALAFLGGRMPAVRTLDDVVALYEAAPHVAIPGDPPEGVRVLDYTVNGDAARLEPIKESMTDVTFTPDQVAALAKSLGVPEKDAAKIEPAKLLEAATAKAAADAEALTAAEAAKTEAARELEATKAELATATAAAGGDASKLADTIRELSAKADQGAAANEALRVMRRDTLIGDAVKAKKIAPAKVAEFVRDYDAAPEVVERIIGNLEPLVDSRSYGAGGGDDGETDEQVKADDELYRQYGAAVGVRVNDNGKAAA